MDKDIEYELAVSTQVVGSLAVVDQTPTQVLTVFVNHTAPQFYGNNGLGQVEFHLAEDKTIDFTNR